MAMTIFFYPCRNCGSAWVLILAHMGACTYISPQVNVHDWTLTFGNPVSSQSLISSVKWRALLAINCGWNADIIELSSNALQK